MAWDIGQVINANQVALGVEVATGKKRRTATWGMYANPLKTEGQILDEMAEESIEDMESRVLQSLGER